MAISRQLLQAYRFHRTHYAHAARTFRPFPAVASLALRQARQDVASGTLRFPGADGYNRESADGLRWVENPPANGLRFVGWCDEIARQNYRYASGIGHTGWHTDDAGCGETMRGAVYQLPARGGKPLYVPGYVESHESPETGARLSFRDVIEGENGEDEEAKREAAYRADRIAEIHAEEQREHSTAYRAGQDAAEAEEAAREARRELLAFLKALRPKKATLCDAPALVEAAREKVESLLESIAAFRAERDRLRDDCPSRLMPSFNDGFDNGGPF